MIYKDNPSKKIIYKDKKNNINTPKRHLTIILILRIVS